MFWRRGRRDKDETGTNRLLDEAEPNVLHGVGGSAAGNAAPGEAVPDESGPAAGELDDEDELEDGELDDEDELEDGEDLEDEEGGEPEPEDMTADLDAQARDYLADNDVWMYGPNAEAVIGLLDQLDVMDPDTAWDLTKAWRRVPKPEREVARKAVRRATEDDLEIDRRVRLAREGVGNWMSIAAENPPFLRADADWPRTCAQAGEAAMDAVSALILEEDLDEKDFAALYGPWDEAVAQPAAEAEAAEAAETAEGDAGEREAAAGADESEDDSDETAEASETAADEPYGPNTNAVRELLSRLWLLPPEQVARLVSNWERSRGEALREAHEALHDLVEQDVDYRQQVRRAQDALTPWLNSGNLQETSAYLGRTGTAESHRQAGPALADAVAAVAMGDLLERRHAELLYEPWFSLVGAPELPEPAAATDGADAGPDEETDAETDAH